MSVQISVQARAAHIANVGLVSMSMWQAQEGDVQSKKLFGILDFGFANLIGEMETQVVWKEGTTDEETKSALIKHTETCTVASFKQLCEVQLGVEYVTIPDIHEEMGSILVKDVFPQSGSILIEIDGKCSIFQPWHVPDQSPKKSIPSSLKEKQARQDTSCILDGTLYLGGQQSAASLKSLRCFSISFILNLCERLPNRFPSSIEYMVLSVYDTKNADISGHFRTANAFIKRAHDQGKACLVHCLVGASRSTAIVLAYLVGEKGMSLREAFTLVKARRKVEHTTHSHNHMTDPRPCCTRSNKQHHKINPRTGPYQILSRIYHTVFYPGCQAEPQLLSTIDEL